MERYFWTTTKNIQKKSLKTIIYLSTFYEIMNQMVPLEEIYTICSVICFWQQQSIKHSSFPNDKFDFDYLDLISYNVSIPNKK